MMVQPPQKTTPAKINPIVIKKYANRRLYNTDTSSYVTLDDLCTMIKNGDEVVVYDAKNGDDITRGVLTQIIVEQESKGQSLLPTGFLRQLIGFYGDNLQGVVPRYLEYTMQTLTKNQSQMRDYFRSALGGLGSGLGGLGGGMFPLAPFEEMSKQNMALFEQAMRLFSPFAQGAAEGGNAETESANEGKTSAAASAQGSAAGSGVHLRAVQPASGAQAPAAEAEDDGSIRQMHQRLDDLQKQIAALSKKDEPGNEG